jgi:hypothetical protein
MKIFKLLLSVMGLLSLISCGGGDRGNGSGNISQPKEWQKAKPISGPAGTARLDHPKALVTDDKFIYFVTGGTVAGQQEGTNNIMKMPVEGGEPAVLFKGGESIPSDSSIALDDTYVYFNADGFRRVPKNGGEAVVLSKSVSTWEIILDNENIYWLPFVGEGTPPKPVYSMPKTGGEPKALTDPRIANGLCLDDKFLYWTEPDSIYKIAKTGGTVEKIYSSPNKEVAADLKMDAENFYFLSGISKRDLMRMPKGGGEAVKVAADIDRFWLGENEIVFSRWIGLTDTALFKISKTGAGETELDRSGFIADLVIGKNKIYLSDLVKIFEL